MFDGNDALALVVRIAQHRRAHSPRRTRLTYLTKYAQGRLQSHFINVHDINVNDLEGYVISAPLVPRLAPAPQRRRAETPARAGAASSALSPEARRAPHRPRSLRSQRGRGRILIVRARRQQTYVWGMRARASAARTDCLTWRDGRDWPCRGAAAVCGMAVVVMMYVLRVSQCARRQAMGVNGVHYGEAYTDLEERYLRTVKKTLISAGRKLVVLVLHRATLTSTTGRDSALVVDSRQQRRARSPKTAMQLAGDAYDEIAEDNARSW
ncbi:hypothetical protein DFH09DRAFT_1310958 [Mycena vulgaris]|nr:hypothetical protein DFH09DRAFT_1310958 [Mycena vulgaris]